MSEVHILSSHGVFAVVANLLNSPTRECHRFLVDVPLPPDAVVVIHANSKIEGFAPDVYDANGAAAWLRRHRCANPIVWIAGELIRVVAKEGNPIANTFAAVGDKTENGVNLPWFAPLYDVALRIPSQIAQLRDAVEVAQRRIGTRKPLVEAAIKRALQTQLENQGVHEDHLWKNLEAVLRFLRGAQCEWMIHPDDAKDVITEIKNQVDLHPEDFEWAKDAQQLLDSQTKRWEDYKSAFESSSRPTPIKTFDELTKAGLPYRLLLIDDQWERRGWKILLQRLLAPYGFEVEADSGQDFAALKDKLSAPHHYNVILLDLNLEPSSDDGTKSVEHNLKGLDILDKIRSSKLAPHTPVILFTGYERLSVERRRQESGLLGYLVKQEESDGNQDAARYYSRLIQLCKDSIYHEIRAILLEWVENWKTKNPKLHRVVGGRLTSALLELDDPVISCHQAGLVGEAAFRSSISIESSEEGAPEPPQQDKKAKEHNVRYSDNIKEWKKNIQSLDKDNPYHLWSSLLLLLRNSAAHPENDGVNSFERLDATFMGALTVFSLHLLVGRPDVWRQDELRVNLVSLVLCRCADELQSLHQDYTDNLSSAPTFKSFVGALPEVVETLRTSAAALREWQAIANPYDTDERTVRDDTHHSEINRSIEILCKAAQDVLIATANLFSSSAVNPIKCTTDASQYLRQVCLDEGIKFMPARQGFGHMGLVARGFLDEEPLDVIFGLETPPPKTLDYDHLCLRTLALTRLVRWSVTSSFGQSNPSFKEMLCEMTQGQPLCDNKSFDLTNALGTLNESPWLGITVNELTIQVLFDKAVSLLLEPSYERLKNEEKTAKDEEKQEKNNLIRLENQLGDVVKQLERSRQAKEDAAKRCEENGEAMTKWPSNRPEWGIFKKHLDEAMQKTRESSARIIELEPKQASLSHKLVEQRKLVDSMEKNRDTREHLLQLRHDLERLDAFKKIDTSDFEPLLLSIVKELAPNALSETALAIDCLKQWVRTSQREDLPYLLNDLEERWKGAAVL